MDFFDRIGETITSRSKDVAKRAKDCAELVRINARLAEEEAVLSKLYSELGRLYFERKCAEDEESFFAIQFEAVREQKERIGNLRVQAQNIRGMRPCPVCNAEMPFTAHYCPTCGAQSEIPEVVTEEVPVEVKPVCAACGTELIPDAKFCGNCGARVEEPTPEEPCTCGACEKEAPAVHTCAACGAVLGENACFCAVCGAKAE